MSKFKIILLTGVALSLPAGAAMAQTQPAPAPRPAPAQQQQPAPAPQPAPTEEPAGEQEETSAVEDVVVTGRANDIRTSVDSISYSVADDLQTATGSLADALRNIPSVEVDPEGNVSLRGDAGVTILVDGRPSGLFTGQNRGQVILQIPADQYARIEVMTNPSAAYRPDGGGGVINLISKPNRPQARPTRTGSIRANVGNDDRWNLGLSGVMTRDKLTLTGDLAVRHDTYTMEADRVRTVAGSTPGSTIQQRNTQDGGGANDNVFVRFSADYRPTDRLQLYGDVYHVDVASDGLMLDVFEADAPGGGIGSAYRRSSDGGFEGQFSGATARIVRNMGAQGHDWTNEVRYNRGRGAYGHDTLVSGLIPAAPNAFERVDNQNNSDTWNFSSAYVRPFASGARLRAGYELEYSQLELDNLVARGASAGAVTPDPLVSNAFHVDQTVHALYATYERPFSEKLSAQFGLRLEQADMELDQITTGTTSSNDYFRAYPTLHLSYQLSDTQTLRGSYSRRVQRPAPNDLNPFLTYQDPLNYRSGNPDLEPQETDSFEFSWQRRVQQTFYGATLYYRDTQNAFTQVISDIGNGVLVTRPENLGARTATGVELVANGRLHSTLRYNASVNLFRQEIDATNIPGGVSSEGEVVAGRLNLNWQPTADDFVQLSGIWTGEQLLAQGTRDATQLINLGYRRKLTDTLAFQLTVRDLLDESKDVTTYDTPTFTERTERIFGGRVAFIGLTWNFGGPSRQQDPQFDFSAPSSGN
ncbi:outer membrane beta-barrel family protein [Brevundimonas kwangchunensis]|uniref:Outer membrane beta-barrel family protein n=1 Tax=Brevundimonas kwangchunensis TaxID=322163 RepID=A0ABP3RXA0_9CAUL